MELSARDAIHPVISSLIWGAYFLRSERVRSTFTRRRWASATSSTDNQDRPAPATDTSGFPSAQRSAG